MFNVHANQEMSTLTDCSMKTCDVRSCVSLQDDLSFAATSVLHRLRDDLLSTLTALTLFS